MDGLRGYDPSWWALGKLFAYAAEEEPFIHFDSDVFLWLALPEAVTSCPLVAGAISALEKKEKHMILIEQFLLAATIEYERSVLGSTREVGYVFASPDCPGRPRVGFTHLLGPSKRNPAVIAKLAETVKSKYLETYERCLDVVKTMLAPG